MMRRLRVLLADDHHMFAEMLQGLLTPHYEVVGTVTDGLALLDAVQRFHPDVVVLDIGMPHLNGLDAGLQIKKTMPAIKLIYLTMNLDPYVVRQAIRNGASGFLLKQGTAKELPEAIEKIVNGGSYVTAAAARALEGLSELEPSNRDSRPEPTARQREVIQLLAEGQSMKQVADTLKITPRTVAAHKYAVMELLQIKSSAELVQYALKSGMIYH
jgi:DNA-binding NarL/FixJ family response regulator